MAAAEVKSQVVYDVEPAVESLEKRGRSAPKAATRKSVVTAFLLDSHQNEPKPMKFKEKPMKFLAALMVRC